ncbi:MAG: TetR/AcrR family transcriptional regulator [Clostridia bacterium]|nr:TetR/AcrR family transcriptional regulator [Clostridia bacterium]
MFSKFLKLKPEKQEQIINAALKVFSRESYKQASTDEIVNAAGISKGALFHYFRSKKDLYLFLYDYVTKVLTDEYFGSIDLSERDILLRLQQMCLLKLSLLKKHPDMMNFAAKAFVEEDDEIKGNIMEKNKEITAKGYSNFQDNIDTSKLREDVDDQMALNIIRWTFEGYANKEQAALRNHPMDEVLFDKWISEINGYIEIIRKCLYKGGNEP